jgi:hypothetical protein
VPGATAYKRVPSVLLWCRPACVCFLPSFSVASTVEKERSLCLTNVQRPACLPAPNVGSSLPAGYAGVVLQHLFCKTAEIKALVAVNWLPSTARLQHTSLRCMAKPSAEGGVCCCRVIQGHYCPAVANRIYKDSELGRGPPVNLKGVAIGNGMTNPAVQFAAYADFALQNNLISQSVSADGTSSACAACSSSWRSPRAPAQPCADHHSMPVCAVFLSLQHGSKLLDDRCPVALVCAVYPRAYLLPQTHDSIQWWGGLCTWGANFCSKHKWAWFCGLTMQYCQVRDTIGVVKQAGTTGPLGSAAVACMGWAAQV